MVVIMGDSQRLGNNSSNNVNDSFNNTINGDLVVNNGMNASDIKILIDASRESTLLECRLVAQEEADKRIKNFNIELDSKLQRFPTLEVFNEPEFQFLLRDAQKTAICTTREVDYSLLSELLIHRSNKIADIDNKAAISKAVGVVGNVTDEALLVITLVHCIITFIPNTGNIDKGLEILENLYQKILKFENLPTNSKWLDNLEINGLVRISNVGGMKEIDDYWCLKIPGYIKKGIDKSSEEYVNILEDLNSLHIPTEILSDHTLNSGYVRLDITSKNEIDDLTIQTISGVKPLSDSQREVLKKIWDMSSEDINVKKAFKEKLKNYPTINCIVEWWNNVLVKFNISININAVGKVIAHTNAKSIDTNIPNLD